MLIMILALAFIWIVMSDPGIVLWLFQLLGFLLIIAVACASLVFALAMIVQHPKVCMWSFLILGSIWVEVDKHVKKRKPV